MSESEFFLWPLYRKYERALARAEKQLKSSTDDGIAFVEVQRAGGALEALHAVMGDMDQRIERVEMLLDGHRQQHFRSGLFAALEMLTETHVEEADK